MAEMGDGRHQEDGRPGRAIRVYLRRALIVVLSASLLALVAVILLRPPPAPRPSGGNVILHPLTPDEWNAVRARGHWVGPATGAVELVVFNDYECPFCWRFEGTLAAVRAAFPNRLAVLYRHYPLSIHEPAAYEKARLAECAAGVGRFADLHGFLYGLDLENPDAVRSAVQEAGIDDPAFLACAGDTARVPAIEEDLALIREIGTRRTPSLFLQGHLLSRAPDSTRLHELVGEMLEGGS